MDEAIEADHSDRIAVLIERLAFLQEEFGACKDELKAKGAWSRDLMRNHSNDQRGGTQERVHKVIQFVRDGDLDGLFEWAESKEGVGYAKWFGWRVERYKKIGSCSSGSGNGKNKGKGGGESKSDGGHHTRGGHHKRGKCGDESKSMGDGGRHKRWRAK